MAYATVVELAEHLGLSESLSAGVIGSTVKTAKFQRALDMATALVDQDTNRTFTSVTETRSLPSFGGDTLWIPDLLSVTTLLVDDNSDGTYETTLTAGTDYQLERHYRAASSWPYEYISRFDALWPRGVMSDRRRRLVRIAGVWGWTAVPDAIVNATLLLAARGVQRGNAALGVQNFGADIGVMGIRTSDPDYLYAVQHYRKELPGEPSDWLRVRDRFVAETQA